MEITKPNLSFDLWREKIIRVFYIIIVLIFIVEVTVFMTFREQGLLSENVTDFQYIVKYIALPTIINTLLATGCHRVNAMSIKSPVKNYTVLITVSLFAAVIAFIHYIIAAILTVFCIPVFLTILFGQKRITVVISCLNGILLTLSSIHSYMHDSSIYFFLNIAVAYTMLISAYLLSTVLIAYNKANSDYIYTSYKTQLSLNEQAKNDPLTGLYNRKTFQSLLKKSMERAKSLRSPMSLAIIDLDDFKEINDTFGHLEGDQVLLHFAELIKLQCSGEETFLSRYGGDEFALIFQRVSGELAYLKLESLRQRCKQVPYSKVRSGKISFSAGISHYIEGDMNETLLFHQADSALYQAKENGRGQTVVYQD